MESLVLPSNELAEDIEEGDSEMSAQQTQGLMEVRNWIQTEAKFYGRTDDEFIIVFLRSCHFNLEKTKTLLDTYYKNRRTMPHWWADRDLRDENIMSLAQLKMTTALMDQHHHQPTVVITKAERIGPDSDNFNQYGRLHSIMLDLVMRRTSCQLNGVIWIIDCQNYPTYFAIRAINPTVVRDMIKSVCNGSPVRIEKVVVVDPPILAYVACKVVEPFLSQTLHQRICFCSCDSVSEHVAVQLLPIEYGGEAGPMAEHDEAFLREMTAFNDYLVEDNKYGYQQ